MPWAELKLPCSIKSKQARIWLAAKCFPGWKGTLLHVPMPYSPNGLFSDSSSLSFSQWIAVLCQSPDVSRLHGRFKACTPVMYLILLTKSKQASLFSTVESQRSRNSASQILLHHYDSPPSTHLPLTACSSFVSAFADSMNQSSKALYFWEVHR